MKSMLGHKYCFSKPSLLYSDLSCSYINYPSALYNVLNKILKYNILQITEMKNLLET